MDRYEQRIEAAYLAHCTPQAAYDWLKEHQYIGDDRPGWFSDSSDGLEYVLFRRVDPLIDLGIARFGQSEKVIRRVYERGNNGTRCAALANPCVGPNLGLLGVGWLDRDELRELVRAGPAAQLEALLKNQFLDDEVIEMLLAKQEEFSDVSEGQYLRMLLYLSDNPRMSKPYDRRIIDGWAEYSHQKVFAVAWDLARTCPTNLPYAQVLQRLLSRTDLPASYEEPKVVIDRWRIEEVDEDGQPTPLAPYLLRSRLADLLNPNDDLLNSDDCALRESFYRRFDPHKYRNWQSFVKMDGNTAFDAIIENDRLWWSQETRDQLSHLSWNVPDPHDRIDAPNAYKAVEERKRRQHPEWFNDE